MSTHDATRKLKHTILVTLGVLATSLIVTVTPSVATLSYLRASTPSSVFGASGSGNGQFSTPLGVAVDDATGDVYVVDQGHSRVEKFTAEGVYISQFSGSETPATSFSNPDSIAVDNASDAAKGDVYVTDPGHKAIDVFNSTGTYLSQIVGTPVSFAAELIGVAVDGSGNVWAYESNGNVDEFSDTGSFLTQFNTGESTGPGFAVDSNSNVYVLSGCGCIREYAPAGTQLGAFYGGGTALAVNESTNELFFDQESREIIDFGNSGERFGEGGVSGSKGIAVNDTTGAFYASQSSANTVAIYKAVVLPTVTAGGASEVKVTSAKLEGTVNPSGLSVTGCYFEYQRLNEHGILLNVQTKPCSPAPGSGSSPVGVSAEITGLEPNATYYYNVVATNANGTSRASTEQSFGTEAIPPVLGQLPVTNITGTTAVVSAKVNPENGATTYRILYGVSASYGEHTSEVEIGKGFGEMAASTGLTGLTPNTTYHYEVIVTNPTGSVTGPDETFTTSPPTPPTATTGGASNITLTTATVSGTVGPEGLESSYELDLGTDTTYGTSIYGEAGGGRENVPVSVSLQDLAPGTTYHYRFVAINSDGRTHGADQTFTTPAYSAPLVQPFTLPLIASPTIAFPVETKGSTTTMPKVLTKAQKLKAALKVCRKQDKRNKGKRENCEKAAHKKFGAVKKAKKRTKKK